MVAAEREVRVGLWSLTIRFLNGRRRSRRSPPSPVRPPPPGSARVRHRSSCATAALARRGRAQQPRPVRGVDGCGAADGHPGAHQPVGARLSAPPRPCEECGDPRPDFRRTTHARRGGRLPRSGVRCTRCVVRRAQRSFRPRLDVLDAVWPGRLPDHRGRWPDLGRASRSATGPAADPDLDWWQCRTDSSASRRTGAGVDADANPAAFAKTTRSPVLDGPEDLPLHRRPASSGR